MQDQTGKEVMQHISRRIFAFEGHPSQDKFHRGIWHFRKVKLHMDSHTPCISDIEVNIFSIPTVEELML